MCDLYDEILRDRQCYSRCQALFGDLFKDEPWYLPEPYDELLQPCWINVKRDWVKVFSEDFQGLWVAFRSKAKAATQEFYDNIVKDVPCSDEEMLGILAVQVKFHLGQMDQECRDRKVAAGKMQRNKLRKFESIVKWKLKLEMKPAYAEFASMTGE